MGVRRDPSRCAAVRALLVGIVACPLTVLLAGVAGAATWTEIGDAGDLPATAQVTVGSGSLDSISGTKTPNEADMFRIRILDPAAFSASTVGTTGFDTQLFLFDASGLGVYANDDDATCGCWQSTLPAGDPNSPSAPGIYYLAISRYDMDPRNGGPRRSFATGLLPLSMGRTVRVLRARWPHGTPRVGAPRCTQSP